MLNCPNPPTGIVRFALRSEKNTADLFEWSGTAVRKVTTEPLSKDFFKRFKDGSIDQPPYWRLSDKNINRGSAGENLILSTPYSMSPDEKTLAAGIKQKHDEFAPTKQFVFLDVNRGAILNTNDMGKWVDSISFDTQSLSVAVATSESVPKAGRYGMSWTLKEKIAAFSGHEMTYEDVIISTVGLDGIIRCSVLAAHALPHGRGFVRWDAD
jgi:hypothetical protein